MSLNDNYCQFINILQNLLNTGNLPRTSDQFSRFQQVQLSNSHTNILQLWYNQKQSIPKIKRDYHDVTNKRILTQNLTPLF